MEYGVQIASIAFLMSIMFFYFKSKRMQLMSTKMFTCFLISSLLNLIFEGITLITINNPDTFINRFAHQLFIGSLNISIFFLFLYVDLKRRTQKRYSIYQIILYLLPLIAAIFVVIFGNLYYKTDDRTGISYSYGPMAMTIYIITFCYVLLVAIDLFAAKKKFNKQEKVTILIGISCWIIIAIIQYILPYSLLSSLGLTLMILFLYVSLENPQMYVDFEVQNTMNHHAFDIIMDEMYGRKATFYLINYTVSASSHKEMINVFNKIANNHFSANKKSMAIFRFKENIITIMYLNEDDVNINNIETFGSSVNIIECPKNASSKGEIYAFLDYISDIKNLHRGITFIDQDFMDRKLYLDKVADLVIKSIEDKAFDIYYQPIYSTYSHKFESAEALVRLKDNKTLGYISPEVFIPIAEKKGIIQELSKIVFENVCRFAKEGNLQDLGIHYIEVNISGVESTEKNLPANIKKIADKYDIPPCFLNFEITETAAVELGNMLNENMDKLREMGFKFSIDDFGTGYSNMKKMADSDFELVKIDKSLIWPCFDDNNSRKNVSSKVLNNCIKLIHSLDCNIVAEGVETKQMCDYLADRKVKYIQGYYFSKPLNEKDFIEFIKKNN